MTQIKLDEHRQNLTRKTRDYDLLREKGSRMIVNPRGHRSEGENGREQIEAITLKTAVEDAASLPRARAAEVIEAPCRSRKP